jgi:maleate cis-trans isomerase
VTIWIGRIEPSMWLEGPWWQEMLPDDVRLAVLSLGVRRLTDADLERAHSQILEKVEALDAEGVDIINVGGSPVVTLHGRAGHERLLAEIAARTNRPFVTALQAEIEGIRAVGGSRVLIASPYPVKQTERRVGILEEEGLTVAAHDSLDIERNMEITQLDPDRVARQAIELVDRHPDGDVVYLPCGSLPVTSVIDRIEAETRRPVVTCVAAQVYACLDRAGYDRPIQGYGRLLDSLGAVAAG